MRKFYSLFILFFLSLCTMQAQVKYTIFPKDKQLYARNIATNTALIKIKGTVKMPAVSFSSMRLKIYRNNILVETLNQELLYMGSKANFNFSYAITAELANYSFTLYGVADMSESELKTASEIVAGDAYIITGQSNAETYAYDGSSLAYKNNFIRVYGMGYIPYLENTWHIAKGDFGNNVPGNAGQWGLVMANQIINNTGIPVAIFNSAEGGKPVDYFQRNDMNPQDFETNYGRLLSRVNETGLANKIRGIFWYQGESDAYGLSTSLYKSKFNSIYDDWMNDFTSVENVFIFQIKYGCGATQANALRIQEALNQLAADHADIKLMSTTGSQSHADNCHFVFSSGYEFFGINMSRLVLQNLYGTPYSLNSEAPAIIYADLVSPTQLNLTLQHADDSYTWEEGTQNDFLLNGTTSLPVSGICIGNVLRLTLNSDASSITSVSYSGHPGNAHPYMYNSNNVGLITFNNLPVNVLFRAEIQPKKYSIVFPNPVKDVLQISGDFQDANYILEIYNLQGEFISQSNNNHNASDKISIPVIGLPAGLYMLRIKNNEVNQYLQFTKID